MGLFDKPDNPTGSRTPGTPGVLVTTADGKRYFFPGGTPAQAMALAEQGWSDGTLTAGGTLIEFGTADGSAWETEKVVKPRTRKEA